MDMKEAEDNIIQWVNNEINCNPYNISEDKSLKFLKIWQEKYVPVHKIIKVHQVTSFADISYLWQVNFFTSNMHYKNWYEWSRTPPPDTFKCLWLKFLLYKKMNLITI